METVLPLPQQRRVLALDVETADAVPRGDRRSMYSEQLVLPWQRQAIGYFGYRHYKFAELKSRIGAAGAPRPTTA